MNAPAYLKFYEKEMYIYKAHIKNSEKTEHMNGKIKINI